MRVPIERVLFLDIETVPAPESLQNLEGFLYDHWLKKYDSNRPKELVHLLPEDYFLEKAGIHALYAQVVCIGLGYFLPDTSDKKHWTWREKVLYNLDERTLLEEFIEKWNKFRGHALSLKSTSFDSTYEPAWIVCGHNIRRFDLPFLGRRLLMQGLNLPEFWYAAQYSQPWQLKDPAIWDTMQMWGFASSESTFVSLEVLAQALGIPFQKSITHTQIRESFYRWKKEGKEEEFKPVLTYCQTDVRVTAKIFVRMQLPRDEQEAFFQAMGYPSDSEL